MRVLRTFLVVLGALFVVLAVFRLKVRQVDRPGLCGSILQGSRYDDGGSSTPECDRLRHDDGVAAAAFAIAGVAALGFVVGHTFYIRRR